MDFKSNLKRIRIKKSYTQKKLSEFLCVDVISISRYEIGTREPDFKTLEKLTHILECDYNDLLK